MERTFDTFDHGDCYNYMNIHDHIKCLKTGYSKVTDHASREIRHGRITKKEALRLVNFYQSQPYRYDNLFYKWLGVQKNSLEFVLRQFANKKYWTETEPGKFQKVKSTSKKPSYGKFIFEANSTMGRGKEHKYITIGKGYP